MSTSKNKSVGNVGENESGLHGRSDPGFWITHLM